MKKILILIITGVCVLFFTAHLAAFERGSREVRGDREYIGNFAGFRGNEIQIELAETGYRLSLPLAADVEFLHKDMGYAAYDPKDIFDGAPVKAIEVEKKIVQVIMLWEIPR